MRENPLKQAFKNKRATFGTWLSFGSVPLAERLATLGFDWLTIDLEHSATNHETAGLMAMVIAARGGVPLVRVPSSIDDHIKRALDLGAYGIVAPMVTTAEQARAVVASCKYPPEGVRSLAGGRNDLAFETDSATYFAQANQQISVIVQVEHPRALQNIDEILAVPGVDCAFVGPQDLSGTLGCTPMLESPDPRFQEALEVILGAARKHGVATGIMVATAEQANRRAEQGFQMIALTNEVRLITTAIGEVVRQLRRP
jgi:4-hydroxy-2-oxoheptanedioate aldolase